MQAAQVSHDRSAHHDVVEVRDDKVGVVDVHVDRQRRQEQPGETAYGEQADEAKGIQHRRLVTQSTLYRASPSS